MFHKVKDDLIQQFKYFKYSRKLTLVFSLVLYKLKSKCQINQWPIEAKNFKGLPKNPWNNVFSILLKDFFYSGIIGCHAVSNTNLYKINI